MARRKRVLSLRCPTCKKLVLRSDPEFPFCSERCRLIDLGKWASDGYVVSTPIFDPDEPEQHRPAEHHQNKNAAGGADFGKADPQRR
ncbi:MAG TPA: DNA gyrase inhibitor YacG [Terriglobales bacterium]|jgi:endogenous inhibitor of DNA gyrase (YacG/DUF329 family)|nr:DNA gyrase inhibitor YacG [Terriglobales bacterium]